MKIFQVKVYLVIYILLKEIVKNIFKLIEIFADAMIIKDIKKYIFKWCITKYIL